MKKKILIIDTTICVACGVCVNACPKHALTIHCGMYAKNYKELCVLCGICTRKCPANAIQIKEVK